jgi:mannosylglycerate hydrolase
MMLTIHVVSHTHWDREWYLTHEQFRLRLVALVDRLLDLLDEQPSYKHFHLDGQTIVLEDYLEIRPEQEPRLRRAIASGRVLVGPWYVMPDEFLVSGESIVRNLARGHEISRRFGTPMPVGYLPDLFGHVGQMPQIWRGFGLDNTILWRGFGGRKAEYWWEAPDGSRVLMMHLPPEGYCNATRVVFDPAAMMARAARAVDYERERTAVGQALLMNGVDHVEPQVEIPDLVEKLSAVPGQHARHSTLPDYVDAVRTAVTSSSVPLERVAGELRGGEDYANLLPGVLSARVYLKQQNARVQTLLESYAEPLAVFAASRGARYPSGELRHAWKTLLQNHPHDSICGCSIDAVHDENMTRFARARQVAESLVDAALTAIADSVAPASGDGLRVLAVNSNASARAQVIEAAIDLPASAEPWRTIDPQVFDRPVRLWPRDVGINSITAVDRGEVPFQVLGEEDVIVHEMSRFETPWALHVRRVHVAWWAEIPPCGYAAFDARLKPSRYEDGDGSAKATPYESVDDPSVRRAPLQRCRVEATDRSAENEDLRMTINDDGTLDVVMKATGATFSRVGLFEDVGDVGDEYNYCPPAVDRRVTNADGRVVSIRRLYAGPLRATFRIDLELSLPSSAAADRRERESHTRPVPVAVDATLDAGSPRVGFVVSVENTVRDHRLRMLFPTGANHIETARADTAFDVIARPARREVPETIRNEAPVSSAPMMSFVDAGDARVGAMVIAQGLMEYEVVPDGRSGSYTLGGTADRGSDTRTIAADAGPDQPAIAVTLIRAVGDLSRDDLATRPSGHAGPPVKTPGAQCLGAHRFDLAFEPRTAPPDAGHLLASARVLTIPPRVVAVRKPSNGSSAAHSFVRIERQGGDVTLSALKRADDRNSVIVRLFNPGDRDGEVAVRPDFDVREAFAVNLLEERQQPLTVTAEGVRLTLNPRQIQTIELVR